MILPYYMTLTRSDNKPKIRFRMYLTKDNQFVWKSPQFTNFQDIEKCLTTLNLREGQEEGDYFA